MELKWFLHVFSGIQLERSLEVMKVGNKNLPIKVAIRLNKESPAFLRDFFIPLETGSNH